MRIFYTAEDIEKLHASGITRLEIGPGVAMTDVAREMAAELGIELVMPGSQPTTAAPRQPAAPAQAASKPSGCQHSPLTGAGSARPGAAARSGGGAASGDTVSQLVNVVSRLAGQGGRDGHR
jgi:hypothetical protein